MSYTEQHDGSPRSDQRFIAEAVTETGVTLRGESDWVPSHWDQDKQRREAVSNVRRRFKQAELLKVSIGAIRVYRETRRKESVVRTWTSKKFDSEVSR